VAGARKPVWRSFCSSSAGTARKRPPTEAAISVEIASPAPFPHVAAPRRARPTLASEEGGAELPFRAAREDSPPHRGGVPRPCWPVVRGFNAAGAGQDASSRNQQTTDASRHPH
jgi:hypothetical protein